MDSDDPREQMLATMETLLSQLDDISFTQLLRFRQLDQARVKQVQQELAKVRRALLKAQQVLSHLDLTLEEERQ